jgi:hypothetical protein
MLTRNFHDEKLMSISVFENSLAIEVTLLGRMIKITVGGLEKLRVSDFKEGNIITAVRVNCSKTSGGNKEEVRSLLMYAYDLDEAVLEKNVKLSGFLNNKIKQYEAGAILILELEPSYGAYLVAVGSEVSEEEN